ncbi:MAG TPA: tagatose 1,6-diphosphate aldolase [Bryobacteraceae bacterium]|nr:tagatose 1,6-diphosphate aldolase [Bryobacteraceae bacterium]
MAEKKQDRLRRLATQSGVIAAVAIDQRKSLRQMIAAAAGVPLEKISDAQLASFKSAVTRVLSPHASAVLVDHEFGRPAFTQRADTCGLLATYEMDGYENPRPHRMLALMPDLSVRRLQEMGADGVKILLSWTPFDDPAANAEKKVLIERIGAECAAVGLPFFLEPVGYDPGGMDPKSAEYARIKPKIVLDSMSEFSQERYGVDVLKVEFPVNTAYVEDTPVFCGTRVWTRDEALEEFRRADLAAGSVPYIYLSAGVSAAQFVASLQLAIDAETQFSGVLCGRATWQDGVPVFARHGAEQFEQWLQTDGVRNLAAINDRLRHASPWHCARPA